MSQKKFKRGKGKSVRSRFKRKRIGYDRQRDVKYRIRSKRIGAGKRPPMLGRPKPITLRPQVKAPYMAPDPASDWQWANMFRNLFAGNWSIGDYYKDEL